MADAFASPLYRPAPARPEQPGDAAHGLGRPKPSVPPCSSARSPPKRWARDARHAQSASPTLGSAMGSAPWRLASLRLPPTGRAASPPSPRSRPSATSASATTARVPILWRASTCSARSFPLLASDGGLALHPSSYLMGSLWSGQTRCWCMALAAQRRPPERFACSVGASVAAAGVDDLVDVGRVEGPSRSIPAATVTLSGRGGQGFVAVWVAAAGCRCCPGRLWRSRSLPRWGVPLGSPCLSVGGRVAGARARGFGPDVAHGSHERSPRAAGGAPPALLCRPAAVVRQLCGSQNVKVRTSAD